MTTAVLAETKDDEGSLYFPERTVAVEKDWHADDWNEAAPSICHCRLRGTLEWDGDGRVEEDVAGC
jgi:hypothetical protein